MAWFEDGTSNIYYEDSGSGEPVLLLPGLFGSITEFAALREALAAAGYRVIAADLPGSGRSEPLPRSYTASYYEDDARSFTSLLEHLTAAPAHLLGFSDGGEVELLMAALTPRVARSLVTWGAAGTFHDPEGHLRDALRNIIDNPIKPMMPFRDFLIATYGEINARAMTHSAVGAMDDIIAGGKDISLSRVHSIVCPTLLIVGEHDMLVSPAILAALAAPIPNAETLVVPAAGHDVHHANPEWFNQLVIDWLKRH